MGTHLTAATAAINSHYRRTDGEWVQREESQHQRTSTEEKIVAKSVRGGRGGVRSGARDLLVRGIDPPDDPLLRLSLIHI